MCIVILPSGGYPIELRNISYEVKLSINSQRSKVYVTKWYENKDMDGVDHQPVLRGVVKLRKISG
jgi:hypothetical protein